MLLWDEFRNQANRDLKRSELLFREKDYGFSAYSLQQGLEKYLKAYLLRYELLDKPIAIRHADMSRLFDIVECRTKDLVRKHTIRQIVSTAALEDSKKKLSDALKTMQPQGGPDTDSMKVKIELWKYSLQQPIGSAYELMFQIKKKTILESIEPIGTALQKYLQDEILPWLDKIPKEQKRLALQKYSSNLGRIGEIITQSMAGNTPEMTIGEFHQFMLALLTQLAVGLKNSGYAKSSGRWAEARRVYMLIYPYHFYESIMKVSPHETIGRYPIEIGGKSSIDLYAEYAENLSHLIDEVKNDCSYIKNAIKGIWERAWS